MSHLCLDTHGQMLTLILGNDSGIQAVYSQPANNRHSESLVTALDGLLGQSRQTKNDLESVAVVSGPGSFTGLRVGLAFAKGLALGLGLRLLAVNSLEALAYSAGSEAGLLSPMIDAKKNQIYAALYEAIDGGVRKLREPVAVAPAEWIRSLSPGTRLLGSGVDICLALLSDENRSDFIIDELMAPSPTGLFQLAMEKYRAREFVAPEELEACYLRPADAVLKTRRR